ncbi:MAG: porin [Nitrosopumilus sp.]
MNKLKTFKGACLVAATAMLPLSQAAIAEVTISGWVNEGVTFYDDGVSSDAVQITDGGNTLGTRMIFAASTEAATGLTVGMEIALEPQSSGTILGWGTLGVADDDQFDSLGVLNNNVWVSGAWGKVTFGSQSMPTDNIAVLEDPSLTLWSGISPVFRGNGVAIQDNGTMGGAIWGNFLNCFTDPVLRGVVGIGIDCNGATRSGVRYDLPAFGPVTIAIGYANDDVYDIAAKWKGSLGRMKASVALGYAINQGVNGLHYKEAENFQIQAGLMDPETGLFGSIAYQNEDADLTPAATLIGNVTDDSDAWWLKIGIKKQWFGVGDTSLSFDYGQYEDQYGTNEAALGVSGSEIERIGVALDQYFGSSLIIYGKWEQLDLDVDCTAASILAAAAGTCGGGAYGGADELDTFTLRAVYFF